MKLRNKVSLAIGVSTGSAALIVAAGVLAINVSESVSSAQHRLELLVSQLSGSEDDKMTAAISAVKTQEVTLVYVDAEGSETMLQDSAGELNADHLVKQNLDLGDDESLVFAISVRGVYDTLLQSVLLASLLAALAAIIAALAARFVLSKDLRQLQTLTRKAAAIAEGDHEQIETVDGSAELVELSTSLDEMVTHLRAATANVQTFMSDASHELRTPLTVIRGYLELMAKPQALDEEGTSRAIERSTAAALRMQKLVDDLLLLAKLGELPTVSKSPVMLESVYAPFILDFKTTQPGRKVNVNDNQGAAIMASKEMLTTFFSNVFSNLTKYTPSDARVELAVRKVDDFLELTIDDAGDGIADLQAGVPVKTFSRFGNAADSRDLGSGLGFSIMQKIAELHGGDLLLERSELGGLRIVARFK